MCGVAGFISEKPLDLTVFGDVLEEIGIRGMHSTGVSWLQDGEIKTKIEKVPYHEFDIPEVKTTSAIFHTRYSTSNIDYPQPVFNDDKSVVHNGVITQLDFKRWKSIYGYGGSYKCDSVLLLDPPTHPLEAYKDSSMAVIELNKRNLTFYRNGQRPLYMGTNDKYVLVASTRLAVESMGLGAIMLNAGCTYTHNGTYSEEKQIKTFKEWQI